MSTDSGPVVDHLLVHLRAANQNAAAILSSLAAIADATPVAEFAAFEIAAAATWTRQAANVQLDLATDIVRRLPAVHAAMASGRLDLPKARVIRDAVASLDLAVAHRIVADILPAAPGLTTGQLQARLAKLVIEADPASAAARQKARQRERRVVLQPAEDSCAHLFGLDLPADAALAASNRITAIARAVTQAGDPRSLDQLRADTFLNLLLDNISPPPPSPSCGHPATGGSLSRGHSAAGWSLSCGHASAGGSLSGGHSSAGWSLSCGHASAGGSLSCGHASADCSSGCGRPSAAAPTGRASGGVELVASLQTLTGLAEQPGHLNGYGPVIADIARQVASQQRDTPWSFAIHDEATGDIYTGALRTRPGGKPPSRTPSTTASGTGPEARFGDPARRFPNAALARHIRARDRTCRAPGCRRPATHADIDHTIAYHQGGRTVPGNLGLLCRHHHHAKHTHDWCCCGLV